MKKKTPWGTKWKNGDVVGCSLDIEAKTISYSLNGSNDDPMGAAFTDVEFSAFLKPAISIKSFSSLCKFNAQQNSLKYLPQGYTPIGNLCTNQTQGKGE